MRDTNTIGTNTRFRHIWRMLAACALMLTTGVIGVAQDSTRQVTAPSEEIRKHIDRQWFLNSLIHDHLDHWRDAGAMPHHW